MTAKQIDDNVKACRTTLATTLKNLEKPDLVVLPVSVSEKRWKEFSSLMRNGQSTKKTEEPFKVSMSKNACKEITAKLQSQNLSGGEERLVSHAGALKTLLSKGGANEAEVHRRMNAEFKVIVDETTGEIMDTYLKGCSSGLYPPFKAYEDSVYTETMIKLGCGFKGVLPCNQQDPNLFKSFCKSSKKHHDIENTKNHLLKYFEWTADQVREALKARPNIALSREIVSRMDISTVVARASKTLERAVDDYCERRESEKRSVANLFLVLKRCNDDFKIKIIDIIDNFMAEAKAVSIFFWPLTICFLSFFYAVSLI